MARKLKTFVTNLGFFDLAVATPSMKAALDAWGLRRNAFEKGFAKQTDDPKIVAATMAKPGAVLRRPVGTNEPYREHAQLPMSLPIPEIGAAKHRAETAPKQQKKQQSARTAKSERAAVNAFAREKAKRDKSRTKGEVAARKEQERVDRAVAKAQSTMDKARKRHEAALAELDRDERKVEARRRAEERRWQAQRRKLKTVEEQMIGRLEHPRIKSGRTT